MQQQKPHRTSTFLSKLQSILSESDLKECISWEPEGKAFTIHHIKLFETSILPKYFRHARFSSFVRQLNMYGFAKVRTTPIDVWQFQNPRFCRDTPSSKSIARRPSPRKSLKRCSVSTAASLTHLQPLTEDEPLGNSNDNFWSNSSFEIENIEPLGDLINKLVEEVRQQEYLLDSDVQEKVETLLLLPTYQPISKRFLPFIMECLGLSEEPLESSRWSSNRSLSLSTQLPDFIDLSLE